MRLIDADALKKKAIIVEEGCREWEVVTIDNINNAQTIPLPDFKEGYKQAIIDGKTNFSKPQGEWLWVGFDGDKIKWSCSLCGRGIENQENYCPNCGVKMKKDENTELPQYHFDRDDFVRVWQSVLDDSAIDDVLDRCVIHTITDHFEMWRDEDEYYIKYLPNGVTINWYKGTHLGRTNTCTDPNFTLEDFEKFLVQLKRDIYGGECEDFKPCNNMVNSDAIKFNKIKAIIDNWAVDDDEHALLVRIAYIIDEEVEDDKS